MRPSTDIKTDVAPAETKASVALTISVTGRGLRATQLDRSPVMRPADLSPKNG